MLICNILYHTYFILTVRASSYPFFMSTPAPLHSYNLNVEQHVLCVYANMIIGVNGKAMKLIKFY